MMHLSRRDLLLLKYAAGRLDSSTAALVELLLMVDPEARRRVAEFEALGGHMLEEEPVVEVSVQTIEIVMKRIEHRPAPRWVWIRFWED